MFKVLESGGRKRRVWSPMTVTVSVAAHALVFGGAAYAATRPAPPKEPGAVYIDIGSVPTPPPPPAPIPQQPRVDEPHLRAPVTGQTIVIPAPTTVPDYIPAPDLTATPIRPVDVTGIGKPGDVIGPVSPGDDRPPTGTTAPAAPNDVVDEGILDAGERPQLSNRGELVRLFERYYPPLMRDSGISGRTVVRCVVGTDGRVEPETIEIVEATNPAFADAAKKAAEKFRFRPASMMGQPVRVLISIPIDWTLPR
jgi:protein TonB